MRPEVGRVNHHHLRYGGLRGQTIHSPGEDADLAPPVPTAVAGLH
jgi:hypothetical protein